MCLFLKPLGPLWELSAVTSSTHEKMEAEGSQGLVTLSDRLSIRSMLYVPPPDPHSSSRRLRQQPLFPIEKAVALEVH